MSGESRCPYHVTSLRSQPNLVEVSSQDYMIIIYFEIMVTHYKNLDSGELTRDSCGVIPLSCQFGLVAHFKIISLELERITSKLTAQESPRLHPQIQCLWCLKACTMAPAIIRLINSGMNTNLNERTEEAVFAVTIQGSPIPHRFPKVSLTCLTPLIFSTTLCPTLTHVVEFESRTFYKRAW